MISKFFIEHPILANVLAVVTIIIGMVSYYHLPVEQYPPITPPTIQVTARYPGASAAVIAQIIGVPIEQAVNGVETFHLHVFLEQQRRLLRPDHYL